jgi:hypothetical protein
MACFDQYRNRVDCVTIKKFAIFPGMVGTP